eukprot:TRINITY_DN7113_c0_g1_i1.p1 TRINITY_DN7113_c0_g1~~TRINITY_DN7113_c0_g1_i1.p1  ORF type:complete len:246 (-),score=42.89 TRINITY_DN7113_c0_g1_i1:17-754(-)
MEQVMKHNAQQSKEKVRLNIGGKLFATTKSTLLSVKGTYFESMLSSSYWKPDEDGEYFIDRDPKYFSRILNFFRNGELDIDELSNKDIIKLQEDLNYYKIDEKISTTTTTSSSTSKNKYTIHSTSGKYIPISSEDTVESLMDNNPITGVCCKTPGFLVVDFGSITSIKNVKYAGCAKNTSVWSITNGEGAKILYSNDLSSWTDSGVVIGKLTNSSGTVSNLNFVARYIKFQHSCYMGFGILDFNV